MNAGHRFDIESIGALCAEKGLYFVVDVMQAIGVVPIDAKAMRATFIGSGSHKALLVPQGLGLLYWDKSRTELEPAYLAAASLAEVPAGLDGGHVHEDRVVAEVLDEVVEQAARLALGVVAAVADEDRPPRRRPGRSTHSW